MKSSTRVLIIGGGVVGCSVAYHLTKLGWSDVMLLERSELTSGSTWHAAGGFHTLNGDTNMAALQGYTIRLYKELEEITGMSCGLHHVGGVTLADTPERLDMFRAERAKHRFMGLETEIIGPEEIAKIAPVTNVEGILGGLYDPLDGHLDPSGTTHAYAKAARMGGAEIVLHTKVLETNPRPDGTWDVVTDKGTIHAEHVVNAAGLWAREVGHMAGIELPLHPMEHQYLVTDDIPEIYERGAEHPHVMDPAGESYLRQEGRGLCIGFYEQTCRPWAVDGTPWEFGHELLPDDFDKIEDSIAFAYRRFPVLERAGVKSVIHGPFTFAPDGNPLVGPVPGLRNYWSACGVMAGFSQGGGVGLSLAQWMVEGEPERDVFAMDVARFGRFLTPAYTLPKVVENYQTRFSVSYPNEENCPPRGPCAPRRCTTSSTRWARSGGSNTGWRCRTTSPSRGKRGSRRRPSAAPTPGTRPRERWPRSVVASASTRCRISGNTPCAGRMRGPGSTGSWRAACRGRGACRCRPCSRRRGGSWGISPSPALPRTTSA
jgi:dimethylglycine dehydrogenase